jgi:hypothetical protein
MQKLYIAGDSFASLANNQPIGNSWSEILANDLGLDLINVARPAASNFSIALQIQWIIEKITPDDFLIVFLTDNYRKTVVDLNTKKDNNKHLLDLTFTPCRCWNLDEVSCFTVLDSIIEQGFFKSRHGRQIFT